jgi:competence protein ComEA
VFERVRHPRVVVVVVVLLASLLGAGWAVVDHRRAGGGGDVALELPMATRTASPTTAVAAGSGPVAGGPVAGGPVAGGPGTTTNASADGPTPADAPLVVAAAGAVVRPGVYRLAAGARVTDLVAAAGGLDPGADVDRVNLAAPVHDGERIYVPRRDQPEVPPVATGGASEPATPRAAPGGGPTSSTIPALVDLNTADVALLDTLPGVGPSTAAAIVAYRGANGRFRTVDDLGEVRGIGPAKLEQLRPLVTVG